MLESREAEVAAAAASIVVAVNTTRKAARNPAFYVTLPLTTPQTSK